MKKYSKTVYHESHKALVTFCKEHSPSVEVCPAQLDIPAKLMESVVI